MTEYLPTVNSVCNEPFCNTVLAVFVDENCSQPHPEDGRLNMFEIMITVLWNGMLYSAGDMC
jgi:hypothetical protein